MLLRTACASSPCCRRLEPYACRGPLQSSDYCTPNTTRSRSSLYGNPCCRRIGRLLQQRHSVVRLTFASSSIGTKNDCFQKPWERKTSRRSSGITSRSIAPVIFGANRRRNLLMKADRSSEWWDRWLKLFSRPERNRIAMANSGCHQPHEGSCDSQVREASLRPK
jgi:hypothetical protein